MDATKKWYQSKVIWLSIIQAVAGVVTVFATQYPDIGGILILKSALDFYLRYTTDSTIQ